MFSSNTNFLENYKYIYIKTGTNYADLIEQIKADSENYDVSEIIGYRLSDSKDGKQSNTLQEVECRYVGLDDTAWENAFDMFLEYPVLIRTFCRDNKIDLPQAT